MRDCRHVCLICVGAGRSDGRHEADSSLHAITKVPRIFNNSKMQVIGINKGDKEAHHHNTKLKASQEHPGDQVMKDMVSLRKYSCMSLEREICCTIGDTHCNVRERESQVHLGIQHSTYVYAVTNPIT